MFSSFTYFYTDILRSINELLSILQKELSAELALRTRAERTKQEEVRGGKRRSTAVTATPRPSKRSVKKEKLLCICRTPYDNTK